MVWLFPAAWLIVKRSHWCPDSIIQQCVLFEDQIEIIHALLYRQDNADTMIWLFGSRTDDTARGGDIDLYVEPAQLPETNLFLQRQMLTLELERRLHNAVYLMISAGHTTVFMRQAKREGIPL